MVQMTLNISDSLAERLQPLSAWLPTVLELTLVGRLWRQPPPRKSWSVWPKAPRQRRFSRIMPQSEPRIAYNACWL